MNLLSALYHARWWIAGYLTIGGLLGGFQALNEIYFDRMSGCSIQLNSFLRIKWFIHHSIFQIAVIFILISSSTSKERYVRVLFDNAGYGIQITANYLIWILLISPTLSMAMLICTFYTCETIQMNLWMKIYYWGSVSLSLAPTITAVVYAAMTKGGIFAEILKDLLKVYNVYKVERIHKKYLARKDYSRSNYIEYCQAIHTNRFSKFGYFDAFFMMLYCKRSLSTDVIDYFRTHPRVCKLCFDPFTSEEQVIVTRDCSHIFHSSCLLSHIMCRIQCPDCQKNIREDLKSQVTKDLNSRALVTMESQLCFGTIPPNSANTSRLMPPVRNNRPRVVSVEQFYYPLVNIQQV